MVNKLFHVHNDVIYDKHAGEKLHHRSLVKHHQFAPCCLNLPQNY